MTDAPEVMVDASFARPGVAFGATSYSSRFLHAHHAAEQAGESRVRLRPFLPSTGFLDVAHAYGPACRRAVLPGYLGRAETSLLSRLGDRSTVFHWLGNHMPPGGRRRRCVVTLHDLMADHYLRSGFPVPARMGAAYKRALRSLCRADGVVVSDEATRERVTAVAPEARVVVAPPGPGPAVTLEEPVPVPGLTKPFLLLLGAMGPHKRFEEFRESFHRSPLPQRGWILVHAGRGTEWRDSSAVSLTGMSDGQIAWLLQNCGALAMPSSYEGWGMPVTEAAIVGVPILVSGAVPAGSHAATLAPVHLLQAMDAPENWEFLLDSGLVAARDLADRRRLADDMWRDHVRLVDALYTSLDGRDADALAGRRGRHGG